MAIVWSAVWAIVLFKDVLAMKQIVGIAFVVLGTVIVNSDQKNASNGEDSVNDDKVVKEVV